MTKVIVWMGTGYCGENACEVVDVDYTLYELKDRDSPESRKVDELAHEMSIENAEMYSHDEEQDEDEDIELELDCVEERVESNWDIFDINNEDHIGDLTPIQYESLKLELQR